jgi:hypothetical protein
VKVDLGIFRDHRIELNERDLRRLEAGEILQADGVRVTFKRADVAQIIAVGDVCFERFTELPAGADGRRRFLKE